MAEERDETAGMDLQAIGRSLESFRGRLRCMVKLRLDPRIRARVDTSDVIQESFAEVIARLPEYRRSPKMPFFLWVRFLTGQKLLQIHRRHLGTHQRDAAREVPLTYGGAPAASSAVMASAIAESGLTSPSGAAMKREHLASLETALDELHGIDREVLVLRHFENLTNTEVAHVLDLTEAAASARYWRALKRLRSLLHEPTPAADGSN